MAMRVLGALCSPRLSRSVVDTLMERERRSCRSRAKTSRVKPHCCRTIMQQAKRVSNDKFATSLQKHCLRNRQNTLKYSVILSQHLRCDLEPTLEVAKTRKNVLRVHTKFQIQFPNSDFMSELFFQGEFDVLGSRSIRGLFTLVFQLQSKKKNVFELKRFPENRKNKYLLSNCSWIINRNKTL